jgi:LPS-assembly protein
MVIVSLGTIMPAAWAADPPCPSQITQPATPAAAPTSGAPTSGAPSGTAASSATSASTATSTSPGTSATAPTAAAAGAAPAAKSAGSKIAEAGNIDITSDEATVDVDGNARVKGNVEARQGDRQIRADEVEYNSKTGAMHSAGHIDYQDPLVHVSGATGSYSAVAGADFKDAQFSLQQRAGRGAAQEMSLTPLGTLDLRQVKFTTCPLHDNSWYIKADTIDLDTHTKIGTGHDAQINFLGVPLMYLPWISFPLSDQRKSGFLFPGIGNTSTNGLQISVPYYWNIAPNYDFTFQPILYSKAGADLGGDVRFLTERQRGDLNWNFLPDDREYGGSRSRVQFTDVAELPDDLRLSLNAENVSDRTYFEDFSSAPEGASTAFLDRSATLSYRSEHWSMDAQAQEYQTIDYTLAETEHPYARVPRIAVDADYGVGPGGLLHYGFDSEVVDFTHVETPVIVTTGWRADVMPGIWLDVNGPGYFVRPAFAWRGTQYELDELGSGQVQRSPSRTLPIASVDTGLAFERPSGSRDQRKLTLEPRIMYLYVPYRDQSQLPVFDTAVPDLAPVMLFRTNSFVGADRVSDANQVSLALTSRLLDAQSGRQFISGTFGQTYYFVTPRVTLPGEAAPTGTRSDFVAQLSLTAFQDWSADAGVQWDPQNQRSERTLVNLQYKPGLNKVINFAYRYERFVTTTELVPTPVDGSYQLVPTPVQSGYDQLELSGAWPIGNKWSIFAKDVYALRNPQPPPPTAPVPESTELERFIGFEYRACCWRVRLGARRYVNSHDGSQTTGIWLQLELNGLSGVGSASDASLSEEIRGYTAPEGATIKTQGPLKGIW